MFNNLISSDRGPILTIRFRRLESGNHAVLSAGALSCGMVADPEVISAPALDVCPSLTSLPRLVRLRRLDQNMLWTKAEFVEAQMAAVVLAAVELLLRYRKQLMAITGGYNGEMVQVDCFRIGPAPRVVTGVGEVDLDVPLALGRGARPALSWGGVLVNSGF